MATPAQLPVQLSNNSLAHMKQEKKGKTNGILAWSLQGTILVMHWNVHNLNKSQHCNQRKKSDNKYFFDPHAHETALVIFYSFLDASVMK